MFFWHSSRGYNAGSGLWWRYQTVLGALLVLAGVIIVVYPAILAFIVAAVVILTGVSMMASGWQMRRFYRRRDADESEIHRW
ncbi:unnamed protein product [marine sediment metagenome]|uniref:Uncharacterized protein n=1 Tax=marine sediment metagenome TaxID=412755 RepID=X0SEK6_9ZZZZ